MVNAIVVAQLMVQPRQHLFALGQLHLHHLHMAGQRMALRGKAPDVQVVYIENAFNRSHRFADSGKLDAAWCAFEKDIERLADDADRAP